LNNNNIQLFILVLTAIYSLHTCMFPTQLNELLHMSEHQVSPLYIRVAVATIVAMTTQNKEVAQRLLITPLLNPLLQCTEGKKFNSQKFTLF